MSHPMLEVIQNRRMVVVCGAGGVGKTTISTGIALAAAQQGRRVLALTVDPSRRLAQTLGVARNLSEPVSIPENRLEQAGIVPPAGLEAWMLDPKLVSDRLVAKLSKDPEERERLMNNRIYRGISKMIAGMQEYMAMEALHDFYRDGRYDLVVLDTPPSRNALAFLDGPRRMGQFLDGRIFSLFVPGEERSVIRKAARLLINRINTLVFGEETHGDLQEFFTSFGRILRIMNSNAGKMMKLMKNPDEVAFLLVTSPASSSLEDVADFRNRTVEMGLPCAGFILNRSQALLGNRLFPDVDLLGNRPSAAAVSGLRKLQEMARIEMAEHDRHRGLLRLLGENAGDGFAIATPSIPGGANELDGLLEITASLAGQ
jgi:anion-transporting  ArsA/GET3 family ATPase